jgi:hypothetical protein
LTAGSHGCAHVNAAGKGQEQYGGGGGARSFRIQRAACIDDGRNLSSETTLIATWIKTDPFKIILPSLFQNRNRVLYPSLSFVISFGSFTRVYVRREG